MTSVDAEPQPGGPDDDAALAEAEELLAGLRAARAAGDFRALNDLLRAADELTCGHPHRNPARARECATQLRAYIGGLVTNLHVAPLSALDVCRDLRTLSRTMTVDEIGVALSKPRGWVTFWLRMDRLPDDLLASFQYDDTRDPDPTSAPGDAPH